MTMLFTLFMLYMMGNTLQIFTILIMVGMVFPQITALFKVNEVFQPMEDEHTRGQLLLPKLAYCGLHVAIVAAALYKFACIIWRCCNSLFSNGIDSSATY